MVITSHSCEYVLLGWQAVPEFSKLCWVVLSEERGGQPNRKLRLLHLDMLCKAVGDRDISLVP